MKKLAIGMICGLTLLNSVSAIEVPTYEEFKENTIYYNAFCSTGNLSEDNQELCKEFQIFLDDEAINIENDINELYANIENLTLSIEEYSQKSQEYAETISILEYEIEQLEIEMNVYGKEISQLTNLITQNLARQDIYKKAVKEYSRALIGYEAQYGKNSDYYNNTKLIIGIFNGKLDKLDGELLELYSQRDTLGYDHKLLEGEVKILASKKTSVNKLKEASQKMLVEYKKQEAELESTLDLKISNLDTTRAVAEKIKDDLKEIKSVNNWGKLIDGNYSLSAGAWNYPESFGGGVHLGADYAASIGTNVIAPANGVVLYSTTGCDNNGYLGNMCGAPGRVGAGNQMYALVVVKEQLYALSMFHLDKSDMLETGTIFEQGQLLAKIGNSGNSTGSHLHIEVHKLQETDILSYMKTWDGDTTFGNDAGEVALKNICSKKDAPCRVAPQSIFN